jgi:D-methionine transport system substrate-binding protein
MFRSKNLLVFILIGLIALTLTLAGCNNNQTPAPNENSDQPAEKKVVKIGATAVPHAEILEFIKPKLAEKGVDLQIQVFNDYVLPNLATDSGDLDLNFFQHIPYLDTFNADRNLNLVTITKVHIEPMGIYSKKVTAVSDLAEGGTIAIPNDPSNGGRALAVLEAAGLIKLKKGTGILGTVDDVAENPKNFKIIMIDAAQLPRVLDDAKITGAVINTNYALEAGLNPTQDALHIEGKDSPYSNVLVAKSERAEDPVLKQVADELNSEDVRNFIEEKYQGAVVPAF